MLIKNQQGGKYHFVISVPLSFTSACTFLFFYHPFPLSLIFIIVVHMYWNSCIKRIKWIERSVAHKSIMTCIQVDIERHWLVYNKASHGTYSVYQLIHLSSLLSYEKAESKCGGSLKFSPSLCESAVWWECRGEVLCFHARVLWRKTYSNAKQIRRRVKRYVALSIQP